MFKISEIAYQNLPFSNKKGNWLAPDPFFYGYPKNMISPELMYWFYTVTMYCLNLA